MMKQQITVGLQADIDIKRYRRNWRNRNTQSTIGTVSCILSPQAQASNRDNEL